MSIKMPEEKFGTCEACSYTAEFMFNEHGATEGCRICAAPSIMIAVYEGSATSVYLTGKENWKWN
jgi:hypothetical protein